MNAIQSPIPTRRQMPALRQSSYETMACPHGYGLVQIEGLKTPDSLPSHRGREVHEIAATNSEHCAMKRVPQDLLFYDTLLLDCGEEAAEIMRNYRDEFTIEWNTFFGAEVTMALDANFQPTMPLGRDGKPTWGHRNPMGHWVDWGVKQSGLPPEYEGILDAIYIMPGNTVARVPDYKSHPRPFEPTTFQARLYCLMLFMHIPTLQEIEFVLHFVRYPKVAKPIKFFREDVPALKREVARERERERSYWKTYEEEGLDALPALPGAHCQYCPALDAVGPWACPVGKLNPFDDLKPRQRLQWRIYTGMANRKNNQIMSEILDVTQEPIRTHDANNNEYTFGPVPKERTEFPLFVYNEETGGLDSPIFDALVNWSLEEEGAADAKPTKRWGAPALTRLRISTTKLKSLIKAKSRMLLHHQIIDEKLGLEVTKVEYRVTKDAQVDDGIDYDDMNGGANYEDRDESW